MLHDAKKAKLGGKQILKLGPMGSTLCPVKAIERRLEEPLEETDSLFGFGKGASRVNLTKRRTNELLAAAWKELNKTGTIRPFVPGRRRVPAERSRSPDSGDQIPRTLGVGLLQAVHQTVDKGNDSKRLLNLL